MLFPRNPKSLLSRIAESILWAFFAFFLVFMIVDRAIDPDNSVELPVRAVNAERPVLAQYPGVKVRSEGIAEISRPTLAQRLLAPSDRVLDDPIHAFWILCFLAIRVLFFRHFNYRDPFTRDSLRGFQWLTAITFVLCVATILRQNWYLGEVRQLTDGHYAADFARTFLVPEFWVSLLLLRVVRIFRKGHQLTLEQQYTV